ncbi:ATP synthase F1 subunit gamma [Psychroflexus planctonicus]|uniref:ATP synthase gamma chain n=1 Tax=Psychroflexus planctonicus TaxID=1526575 RepID=A0ABQ1SDR8_9FLAO|nr:ATP synthase F1 subunit gamma [Psychroflexus planctonicus]GGE25241.1 ATP synthase gamma chain [Psychroflexus planctonicus]
MANLKDLRNRISSVGSTMQITSAMKMVSAAKLSKAQDAIAKMRPYADTLKELLQDLSASLDNEANSPFTVEREVKNVLIIAVSSNKGLAGAFNSNIVKQVKTLATGRFKNEKISLAVIGKKAYEVLDSKSYIIDYHNEELVNHIDYKEVASFTEKIMKDFEAETYDQVVLVYNHFKNAGTQIVLTEDFLPIKQDMLDAEAETNQIDYIFEQEKQTIVEELIPKALKMQLFKALRDSIASEHGARMTAMHKATDNAKELRDDLKLSYNKARQAAITNEILEIVAGAEALSD